MNLRDYIEMGEMEAGSQVKLAEYLMMNPANIRNAKRGTQGIPDAMCIKLAKLVGATEIEVIAASNLVTEKNPERRKIFEGYLVNLDRYRVRGTSDNKSNHFRGKVAAT